MQPEDLGRWPGHLYLNASGAFASQGLERTRLMPTYLLVLEVRGKCCRPTAALTALQELRLDASTEVAVPSASRRRI